MSAVEDTHPPVDDDAPRAPVAPEKLTAAKATLATDFLWPVHGVLRTLFHGDLHLGAGRKGSATDRHGGKVK